MPNQRPQAQHQNIVGYRYCGKPNPTLQFGFALTNHPFLVKVVREISGVSITIGSTTTNHSCWLIEPPFFSTSALDAVGNRLPQLTLQTRRQSHLLPS